MSTGREIKLIENPDGWWTAVDLELDLTAQGATRERALESLDEVVEAVTGDGGHAPTDEEIRALGVDPDIARSHGGDLPDILQ